MPRNEGGSRPAKEEMLLFLDFEGVLHPFSGLSDRPATASEPFVHLARLESVLRAHPHVLDSRGELKNRKPAIAGEGY